MTRISQNAFNAGIIAEGMYARSDTEKFQKGVKDALNLLVRPQGGLANRAGLEAVTRCDASGATAKQRLIPFAFSTEQTYQIEFSDNVFRIIRSGAYVLDTSVGDKDLSAVTSAASAALTLANGADTASFPVGCFVYVSDPNGSHKLHEAIVRVTGISGSDLEIVGPDGAAIDTTVGAWGTLGAGATVALVYQQAHSYALEDMANVQYAQDADTLYLAHPLYPPRKIGRLDHDDWTIADVNFSNGPAAPTGLTVTHTRGPDVNLGYMLTYKYAVAAISANTFEEGLPSAMKQTQNDLYYRGSVNHLSWDAVPGASRYAVYRVYAGSLGYIGTTTGTTFDDENITADTATGPRVNRNPFSGAGNYPSTVSFYEQRLAFGATINDPQLIEMSRVDNPENFCSSYPSLADDAFRFRLRDTRVNKVQAFVPSETFTILTSGGEWEIAAQGDGEYVRPDQRKLAPLTNFGAASFRPLHTGSVVLFVEPSQSVIRDYRPDDNSAPPGDLTVVARDLFEDRKIVSWDYAAAPNKIVWAVLDDGTLLSMTYMPEHDVWGWTRHQIAGENARVSQVSVIREGAVDRPYFVVTRTINGQDVTYTERLADRIDTDVTRAYFLDGGRFVDFGVAQSEVTGLLHLRGLTVSALADGDVVEALPVDATGTVDFGEISAERYSIGLAYESIMQTLDVQMDVQGLGSSEGRYKSTSELAIKLRRTRGVEAGVSLDRMYPMKEWEVGLVGGPIPLRTHTPLITVSGDWLRDATTYVRQRNPLPMTVLGIAPEWEIGE